MSIKMEAPHVVAETSAAAAIVVGQAWSLTPQLPHPEPVGALTEEEDGLRMDWIRQLHEDMPDAVFFISHLHEISACNRAAVALFGYEERELIGRKIDFVWRATPNVQLKGRWGDRGAVRAGLAITKSGAQFPTALTIVRKHGEKGFFTAAIFEDYQTESETLLQVQELQHEVARLARVIELGEMASTLAHELSQPLSSIAAYSQGCGRLATDGPRRDEELREALLEITQNALWAGSLVQNIREFAVRGTSERKPQEMHELIHRAIRLALMGSRRKDLHTNFQLKAARDVVLADSVQVVQVLTNLLRNALEATECAEQPSIGIRTTVENFSSLVVEVSDNGCGIAAEMEETLFRPFVSGKPHGLGMGLALCKRIVEAHGGRISAHKGRESGSIFSFSIPLVETKTDGERPYDPSRR
ncbi:MULTISPECIES: ATP-binding protein [unclassified Rhizobium]|uniref:sensor histidine kinase n=1 Tax=unclassified Rhizobium TaxID=2613769 RepID=UPI001A99F77E|nr:MULTISPECIES: ATP-binding protein [unclassified Rhizobium]MBX5159275.1 PAS domain S-box protein [Rhizobium sp. NZLR8]MBX5162019.1 PAS domain S-box protein [Rhizobium sp. NZLR4b]MBX5181173.1 PAS domain S-box protein [Rhizobium sp. NZLR5]MBX5197708.1 PAS domain S-box protein [Rhizobium sp. NZLR10]MBX5200544.1 PAS domain S-box protein [Rhizobium sp. NZLR1]